MAARKAAKTTRTTNRPSGAEGGNPEAAQSGGPAAAPGRASAGSGRPARSGGAERLVFVVAGLMCAAGAVLVGIAVWMMATIGAPTDADAAFVADMARTLLFGGVGALAGGLVALAVLVRGPRAGAPG